MTTYRKTMAEALKDVYLDESVIDKVKEIASKKSAKKIDGVMVDSFTASAISQVYDKVNDANKKKMEKLPITKLANLAFKMMQKSEFVPEEVELDEAVKVGDTVKVKLNRKGKEYIEKGKVTKIEKDSIIVKHDFSRTPSRVSMKNIVKEEVEVDEGKMSQLHQHIKDGKSAKEIAKIMKLDVKTIKALMDEQLEKIKGKTPADNGRRAAVKDDIEDAEKKGDKKLVAKLKETTTILDRIDKKLKERRNG